MKSAARLCEGPGQGWGGMKDHRVTGGAKRMVPWNMACGLSNVLPVWLEVGVCAKRHAKKGRGEVATGSQAAAQQQRSGAGGSPGGATPLGSLGIRLVGRRPMGSSL